jgi:hypothetical protein
MVGSSVPAFVGVTPDPGAYPHKPKPINNWMQFDKMFASVKEPKPSTPLARAVYAFFENGGSRCYVLNVGESGQIAGRVSGGQRQGILALDPVEEAALVAVPGYATVAAYEAVLSFCERTKRCFAILDCPEELASFEGLATVATAKAPSPAGPRPGAGPAASGAGEEPGYLCRQSDRGAYYAPWYSALDPFDTSKLVNYPPSGAMAGIYARVDTERGIFKAPANEIVRGATGLPYEITRQDQGPLNQAGVNIIRSFPSEGIRVWGARTRDPDSQWRYIPVRRTFIMVEESIIRHTRWVVFEPNDPTLWGSIIRDLTDFLMRLWRQGALMGRSPREAFFVKCDHETNPPESILAGEVNIMVGIAVVKPAEFVIFQIGQHQGGTEVTEGSNA